MLNYVWIGLILLGFFAAVYTDVHNNLSDKYHNGQPVNASILFTGNKYHNTGNNFNSIVSITKEEFNSHYGSDIGDDLNFSAEISFDEDRKSGTIYFKINNASPGILLEIAKVSGDPDDLGGNFYLDSNNNKKRQCAKIIFEKVRFAKLKNVTNAAIDYALTSVKIVLGLIGIMAMWLGIMKIAEEAGIIRYIAQAARPITKFLFPDIPADHPAMGSMIMNISATFLGLGNAATPFGIKAMEDLDKLNSNKGTATNAMCTFLVINTASFALMPTTAIALRAASGSSQPAIIIGTTMFGSFCATVVGITAAKLFEKFPFKFSEFKLWLNAHIKFIFYSSAAILIISFLAISGLFSKLSDLFSFIKPGLLKNIIEIISTLAIPLVILVFVILGVIKKVKIYETFVEGAKEGFTIAVTIIPYLVAILMAIGIFRAGGAMDWLTYILHPFTDFIGMPAEALPMALMRPLSGSGSLGIMAEIISVHGPDSFIGILVSTIFGSTETTFYVLAVYFGAINIKNTRHALPAGLISDAAGILAALFIVRLLFSA